MNIDLKDIPTKAQPAEGPPRTLLKHLEGDNYAIQIDNSTAEHITTCPRRLLFSEVRGKVPTSKSALVYGSGMHLALEVFYTQRNNLTPDALFQAMVDAAMTAFTAPTPIDEWRTPQRLIDAIAYYIERNADDRLTPELDSNGAPFIERAFSVPLSVIDIEREIQNPSNFVGLSREEYCKALGVPSGYIDKLYVYWTGRIDMLASFDNKLYVLDHKTSSIVGPAYYKTYELSQQTRGYVWAAQKLIQKPIDGFILNLIIGRKKTRTGVCDDFARRSFHYTDELIIDWYENTLTLMTLLAAMIIKGDYPAHFHWCVGKYGLCEYHQVCTAPSHQREMLLSLDSYEQNTWSPLSDR